MNPEHFYGSDQAFFDFSGGADSIRKKPLHRGYLAGKRLFDIAASACGLLLILPLFPFIVLLIKLESAGPIFFRQARVGYRGRMFYCYKFRSMRVDAEQCKEELAHLNEATGAAFKIKEDPRVTRVGRFLRSSSLDEFPQLLNVLRGEMSVVGPRPQIPTEVGDYTPDQAARLIVRPGLTCLWQISGRSHLEFAEWMRLDREYVRQAGALFDLDILVRTLPAVIERKGAY